MLSLSHCPLAFAVIKWYRLLAILRGDSFDLSPHNRLQLLIWVGLCGVHPAQRWYLYQFSTRQVYGVLELRVMPAMQYGTATSFLGWRRAGVCHELATPWFPWFRTCLHLGGDTYCNIVDDVAPVVADSFVSSLVEDKDNWKLGCILLSGSSNAQASLCVAFTAIQTQCREFNFTVLNKGGGVFWLGLKGLHEIQKVGKAKARVGALEASEPEQLAKMGALESHEWELFKENRSLEHNLLVVRV